EHGELRQGKTVLHGEQRGLLAEEPPRPLRNGQVGRGGTATRRRGWGFAGRGRAASLAGGLVGPGVSGFRGWPGEASRRCKPLLLYRCPATVKLESFISAMSPGECAGRATEEES